MQSRQSQSSRKIQPTAKKRHLNNLRNTFEQIGLLRSERSPQAVTLNRPLAQKIVDQAAISFELNKVSYNRITVEDRAPRLVDDPNSPLAVSIDGRKSVIELSEKGSHPLNILARELNDSYGPVSLRFDPYCIARGSFEAALANEDGMRVIYLPMQIALEPKIDSETRFILNHEIGHLIHDIQEATLDSHWPTIQSQCLITDLPVVQLNDYIQFCDFDEVRQYLNDITTMAGYKDPPTYVSRRLHSEIEVLYEICNQFLELFDSALTAIRYQTSAIVCEEESPNILHIPLACRVSLSSKSLSLMPWILSIDVPKECKNDESQYEFIGRSIQTGVQRIFETLNVLDDIIEQQNLFTLRSNLTGYDNKSFYEATIIHHHEIESQLSKEDLDLLENDLDGYSSLLASYAESNDETSLVALLYFLNNETFTDDVDVRLTDALKSASPLLVNYGINTLYQCDRVDLISHLINTLVDQDVITQSTFCRIMDYLIEYDRDNIENSILFASQNFPGSFLIQSQIAYSQAHLGDTKSARESLKISLNLAKIESWKHEISKETFLEFFDTIRATAGVLGDESLSSAAKKQLKKLA